MMRRLHNQRALHTGVIVFGGEPAVAGTLKVATRLSTGYHEGDFHWSSGVGASSSTAPLNYHGQLTPPRVMSTNLRDQVAGMPGRGGGGDGDRSDTDAVVKEDQHSTSIVQQPQVERTSTVFDANESAEARLVSLEDAYHEHVDGAWSRVPKMKLFKTAEERHVSEGFEDIQDKRNEVELKRQGLLAQTLVRDELSWEEGSPVDILATGARKKSRTPVTEEGIPTFITPLARDLVKRIGKSGVIKEEAATKTALMETLAETRAWAMKRAGKSTYNLPNLSSISRIVGQEEMENEMREMAKNRVFTEVGDDAVVRTYMTQPDGTRSELDAAQNQRRATQKRLESVTIKNQAAEMLKAARSRSRGAIGSSIDYTKMNLKPKRDVYSNSSGRSSLPADSEAAAASLEHGLRTLEVRRKSEEVRRKDGVIPGGGGRGGNDVTFPEKIKTFRNLSIHHKKRKDFFVSPKHLPLDTPSTSDVGMEQLVRYDIEDFTNNPELLAQRKLVETTKDQVRRREIHEKSPADVVDESALNLENAIKKLMLEYYQKHPTNLMIVEHLVKVVQIQQPDGDFLKVTPTEMHVAEARELAKAHGLDLVRHAQYRCAETGHDVALCKIEDSEARMQAMIETQIKLKGLAPKVHPCVEVGFRGVTRDFMVEVKAKFIAEFLYRRYPVRICIKEYGTPREGFPVLEQILHTVKSACRHMKAYHTASRVRSGMNEISVYLHPDTTIRTPSRAGSLPPGGFHHPSPTDISQAMETQLLEDQQEIHVDNWGLQDRTTENKYASQVSNGTAWTIGSGMKPGQLRKLKRAQGWLPKSNRKIHSQRHDNDMGTTVHRRGNHEATKESNVDQSIRATALLTLRQDMTIEDMHDMGHTEGETGVVNDHFYSMQGGDSLQLGHMKNELGIGRNRKSSPKRAHGFATQGVGEADGVDRGSDHAFGGGGM